MSFALPLEYTEIGEAPKPFLKWAGGKSQLLDQFAPFIPREFGHYHEPFTGSAAVFWFLFTLKSRGELNFGSSRLTDSNAELINCYEVVRDDVLQLIEKLRNHRDKHEKDYYYQIRALSNREMSKAERAARFIYLNKTCFNGLYRVNRAGKFNVPIGSYQKPRIFDERTLLAANRALQDVMLQIADFRDVVHHAKKGDFIYFDPPYAPLSKTSSFTSYTSDQFGSVEQEALALTYSDLDKIGCKVMLSNSWVEEIQKLYKGYNCIEVKASRAINSKADKRGKISELLVLNYE